METRALKHKIELLGYGPIETETSTKYVSSPLGKTRAKVEILSSENSDSLDKSFNKVVIKVTIRNLLKYKDAKFLKLDGHQYEITSEYPSLPRSHWRTFEATTHAS